MLMCIEVTEAERLVLWYEKKGVWGKTSEVAIPHNAIVVAIAKLFAETGEALGAVSGLGLSVESSRFTTVRLAATIVNTLGFALHIPVVSVSPRCSPEELRSLVAKTAASRYILPEYRALPRLGKSKIQ